MKKVRVLQLIDSLSAGGAEVLAVNIANLLSEIDNVSSFLCATRKEGVLKEKVNLKNYIFTNRRYILDIKAFLKLRKFIKKEKIQIIHAHSTSCFMACCIKITLPKIKIIWHDHYGKIEFLEHRKIIPLKLMSFFFTSIIVVNTKLLEWSKKYLKTKKVVMITNFAQFDNLNKKTKLKGQKGKRIVILANIRQQKDYLNLLKAFLKIKRENPTWTLHIVGNGRNDDYELGIHKFISKYGLTTNVYFYGVCLDIKYILSQADIGILSSESEGLSIALLEYGLAKLPVVATDVGECDKLINNGKSGFIVKRKNSVALYNALKILIHSCKKRENFGNAFHKEVIEKYSKDNFIEELLKIYL